MILLRHMEDTYSYLITILVCWLYIGCRRFRQPATDLSDYIRDPTNRYKLH